MKFSIDQETQKWLDGIGKAVDSQQVGHLMTNPGHNNGHNIEQYLKNDAWQRGRYRRAKKAVVTLKDFLSF